MVQADSESPAGQPRPNGNAVGRRTVATLHNLRRRLQQLGQLYVWIVAILLGTTVGFVAVGFEYLIGWIQFTLYGVGDFTVGQFRALEWWEIMSVPVGAGLVVGLLLQFCMKRGRSLGIADVIRARDLARGRVRVWDGLVSGVVAAISLGGGASTGREGPVVHLAATCSSALARFVHAGESSARMLLGCAAAAGVSALFNAPIAGTIFALEVVLGSYSIRAFAPIVAASAAGTVVSRSLLGDFPSFIVPPHEMGSLLQLPAFAILGLFAAAVAVLMSRMIFAAENVGDRFQAYLRMPLFMRPAVAGLLLGGMGCLVPEVIGVGYATTTTALGGGFLIMPIIVIFVAKLIAVAVSFGGRFGGGVFSPSLMVGALLGAGFGTVMLGLFPGPGLSIGLYALAGMGAVSAAMLGAPLSTTLIVFELSGDYRTALAVMAAVSVAVIAAQPFLRRSFFYEQLERAGLPLAGGRHDHLVKTLVAVDIMRPHSALRPKQQKRCAKKAAAGTSVPQQHRLSELLQLLQTAELEFVPVVDDAGAVCGAVFLSDALRIYNRTLAQTYAEEHD